MIHENQYSDRSISNEKIKLQILTNDEVSESANIAHSKLDISWSIPVSSIDKLPTVSNNGEARIIKETGHIYVSDGTNWKQETGKESYPIWLWNEEKIYYNNNVGIGTDNPTETLHVNGSIKISNSSTSFKSSIDNNKFNFNDLIYIDNKIGINTNNPQYILDVVGDSSFSNIFTNSVSINQSKIFYEENKLKLESETINIKDSSSSIIEFSDSITVYRDMIISGKLIFNSDIIPFSNDKNIGSNTEMFNNSYIKNSYVESIIFDSNSYISKTVDGISYSEKFYTQELVSDHIKFSDEVYLDRVDNQLSIKMNKENDYITVSNNIEELVKVDKDNFVINKNLIVKGTTTYVESTNLIISDNEIILRKSDIPSDGNASFTVNRESGNVGVLWNDSNDRWELSYGSTAQINSKIFTFEDLNSNVVFNSNIGIGVSNPGAKLSIQTGSTTEIGFSGTSNAKINSIPDLQITAPNVYLDSAIIRKVDNDNYKLEIESNSKKLIRLFKTSSNIDKRFEITDSFSMYNLSDLELNIKNNNFGIGKISENEKFEVNGNIRCNNKLILKDTGLKEIDFMSTSLQWKIAQTSDNSLDFYDAKSRLYISSNDNIGIKCSTPQYSLDVKGGALFSTESEGEDFIVSDKLKGTVERVLWYEYASSRLYLGNLGSTSSYAEVDIRGSQKIEKNLGIGKEPGSVKLKVYQPYKYSNNIDISTDCTKSAIVIDTLYENNFVQPGIVWTTTGNNDNIPKAGIWTKTTDNGTKMFLGTSTVHTYGLSGNTISIFNDKVGINNENPSESLEVNGNVKALVYKSGSSSGITTTVDYVTDIQIVNGVVQKKKKTLTITGGIITNVSTETGWIS